MSMIHHGFSGHSENLREECAICAPVIIKKLRKDYQNINDKKIHLEYTLRNSQEKIMNLVSKRPGEGIV